MEDTQDLPGFFLFQQYCLYIVVYLAMRRFAMRRCTIVLRGVVGRGVVTPPM